MDEHYISAPSLPFAMNYPHPPFFAITHHLRLEQSTDAFRARVDRDGRRWTERRPPPVLLQRQARVTKASIELTSCVDGGESTAKAR